jgi:hypothetical protein
MDARDQLRRAAAGCSLPDFSRRITALRDSVGTVLNDFLRAMAASGKQSDSEGNESVQAVNGFG